MAAETSDNPEIRAIKNAETSDNLEIRAIKNAETSDNSEKRAIKNAETSDNSEIRAIKNAETSDKPEIRAIKNTETSDNLQKIECIEGISSGTKMNLLTILEYMETHTQVKNSEIAALLKLSPNRVRIHLALLVEHGFIQSKGNRKERIYIYFPAGDEMHGKVKIRCRK